MATCLLPFKQFCHYQHIPLVHCKLQTVFSYSHCCSASYTPVFRRGLPFILFTAHAADLEAVSQLTLDRGSGRSLHATEQQSFTALSGLALQAIISQKRSLQPILLASITRPCIRCGSQMRMICSCMGLNACCIRK